MENKNLKEKEELKTKYEKANKTIEDFKTNTENLVEEKNKLKSEIKELKEERKKLKKAGREILDQIETDEQNNVPKKNESYKLKIKKVNQLAREVLKSNSIISEKEKLLAEIDESLEILEYKKPEEIEETQEAEKNEQINKLNEEKEKLIKENEEYKKKVKEEKKEEKKLTEIAIDNIANYKEEAIKNQNDMLRRILIIRKNIDIYEEKIVINKKRIKEIDMKIENTQNLEKSIKKVQKKKEDKAEKTETIEDKTKRVGNEILEDIKKDYKHVKLIRDPSKDKSDIEVKIPKTETEIQGRKPEVSYQENEELPQEQVEGLYDTKENTIDNNENVQSNITNKKENIFKIVLKKARNVISGILNKVSINVKGLKKSLTGKTKLIPEVSKSKFNYEKTKKGLNYIKVPNTIRVPNPEIKQKYDNIFDRMNKAAMEVTSHGNNKEVR